MHDQLNYVPVSAFALVAVIGIGGCGNLTAGGARGTVESAVSGDAPEASSQTGAEAPVASKSSTEAAALIEGQVDATLRIYLENEMGDRIPVVAEDSRTVVDVQGQTEATLSSVELPVGSYPRVRIVFTDVHADVEAGLLIGGISVVGRIDVGEPAVDSMVVERQAGILLEENRAIQLLVDMNSPSWLAEVDLESMLVDPVIFQQEVEMQVR